MKQMTAKKDLFEDLKKLHSDIVLKFNYDNWNVLLSKINEKIYYAELGYPSNKGLIKIDAVCFRRIENEKDHWFIVPQIEGDERMGYAGIYLLAFAFGYDIEIAKKGWVMEKFLSFMGITEEELRG